jgi:hypothetical protein
VYTYEYMKNIIYSLLSLILLSSCEKDGVICDTSFRTNTVYSRDTLVYYEVEDMDRDSIIYSDSNVIGNIPIINDSYLSVIGRNNSVGLNIRLIPVNSNLHVIGLCAYSDNCHIYTPRTLDTLVTR